MCGCSGCPTCSDNVSGEQAVYAYDALNRLASATAASGSWGQSYAYDGFGNLTDQNVTAGSAPAYHVVPDPNTNHLVVCGVNSNHYPARNVSTIERFSDAHCSPDSPDS